MDDMQTIIDRAERNIWKAIDDYRAHTSQTEVLDDITESFVKTLAVDSSYAKQELRELFSKSPVYDAEIDALVINGTRTHNPDYNVIRNLAEQILNFALYGMGTETSELVRKAICLFANPNQDEYEQHESIRAINQLAPKAYTPTKKPSRVFKALCVALGVADESAGSQFQRLFAQFADELNAKKISFKLYASLNPAHFITMSNPKYDSRGCTLTSCHSFNSTDYEYNNGCSGYARDEVSFIVFTVEDPRNPETLNNRKTTRQIFAYKPGNGLLMQSRMYNTAGGTHGAQEDSKLYRDLIQREISMLENVPNLWKTFPYLRGHEHCVYTHPDFGGYADWTYEGFEGKVSIRVDHENDFEPLTVGNSGLCIVCGCEISSKLYCDDCDEYGDSRCDECEERCCSDDLHRAYNDDGDEVWVCDDCLNDHYRYCEECDEYHHEDRMTEVSDGYWVCDHCLAEYYTECEDCGDYYRNDEIHSVQCNGYERQVCDDCVTNYEVCPHCHELVEECSDGTCPSCGAIMDEEETEDEAV